MGRERLTSEEKIKRRGVSGGVREETWGFNVCLMYDEEKLLLRDLSGCHFLFYTILSLR